MRLEAGRLTRSVASPAKLQPTEERGELALWLLPNDDLALTWRATLPAPALSGGAGGSGHGGAGGGEAGGGGQPERVAASLTVWEALAHFPEAAFYESEEPGGCGAGVVQLKVQDGSWSVVACQRVKQQAAGCSWGATCISSELT